MPELARPRLSDPEATVLAFIEFYIADKGYPPSCQEIAKGCDYKSTSTVFATLNRLERKGYLNVGRRAARALRVVS